MVKTLDGRQQSGPNFIECDVSTNLQHSPSKAIASFQMYLLSASNSNTFRTTVCSFSSGRVVIIKENRNYTMMTKKTEIQDSCNEV